MQDEQYRKTSGAGRTSVSRPKSSLFARSKRLLFAGFCLLAALLFTGTAVFPGTYPLGIAMVSAAGGVLSAAAVTVGALFGSIRIPAAGGVYALVFVGLFAVRILAAVWLNTAGLHTAGDSPSGTNRGGQDAETVGWNRSGRIRAVTEKTRILFLRLLEADEDGEGRSGIGSRALKNPSSAFPEREKINAGTVLREHIRIRMALSACAALFAGAWSVVAGGYEYRDLFGAVFAVLTTPLLTYLFYAASDWNMRASPFREFGVYALMAAAALSLHGISASLFSLRIPVDGITGEGAFIRQRILFDAGAFFALTASLVVTRNHGWQRGALAGVLCGITMDPDYVPMYALSAVSCAVLSPLPSTFGGLGAGIAALSWAIFINGIDGFTAVIPPVSVMCAVLIPLFRYDLAIIPEDLFGILPFLSAAGRERGIRNGEETGTALLAAELDRRVKKKV